MHSSVKNPNLLANYQSLNMEHMRHQSIYTAAFKIQAEKLDVVNAYHFTSTAC